MSYYTNPQVESALLEPALRATELWRARWLRDSNIDEGFECYMYGSNRKRSRSPIAPKQHSRCRRVCPHHTLCTPTKLI